MSWHPQSVTIILTEPHPVEPLRRCAACDDWALLPSVMALPQPVFVPLLCWDHIMLRVSASGRSGWVDTTLFPGYIFVQANGHNVSGSSERPYRFAYHITLKRARASTALRILQMELEAAYLLRYGGPARGLVRL